MGYLEIQEVVFIYFPECHDEGAQTLAGELPQVVVVCLHTGRINTGMQSLCDDVISSLNQ